MCFGNTKGKKAIELQPRPRPLSPQPLQPVRPLRLLDNPPSADSNDRWCITPRLAHASHYGASNPRFSDANFGRRNANRPISNIIPPRGPLRGVDLERRDTPQTPHTPQQGLGIDEIEQIQTPQPVVIDPLEGHSNIGRPMTREHRSNLSEVLKAAAALRRGGHVRSPSGNELSAEEFRLRPDRPRTIEERQEAIRQRVAAANAKEREKADSTATSTAVPVEQKKEKRSCWTCFWNLDNID